MRRLIRLTLLSCATLLIPALTATLIAALTAACVPLQVTTYVEPGAELSRLRVFEWAPMEPQAIGDPRLDSNPFFHRYLREAVERQLLRRGYVEATMAGLPADFRLHYHASVTQRIDVEESKATDFDEGTLVVDMNDARGGGLLWRGVARKSIQGIIDDQSVMEEDIGRVITRVFAEFPARPLGATD